MLKYLSIRNYALIEALDIEFAPGLTTITGETGAGKSIILGALSMLMGGRADSRVITDTSAKSRIEAVFTDVDPALQTLMKEKGIDWITDDAGSPEITIRRELSASGRSKVLVNDTSVTIQTLSLLAGRLIDIHSQRANAKINDPAMRLDIIDSLAGNAELREEFHTVFSEYVEIRRRIAKRKKELEAMAENLEFMRFQLEQLDKLNPKRGELAEIERRFEILSDADEIRERLQTLMACLGDSQQGATTSLAEALGAVQKIDPAVFGESADDDPEKRIAGRLHTALVEVKDICETVENVYSAIDANPEMLARLSQRMNLYYEAVKRFRVKEADELVELHAELKEKVTAVSTGDAELPEWEREARRLARLLKERADALTESRRKAAEEFSEKVCDMARPLGLPNIRFIAEVGEHKMSATGQDEVTFLCSFNKNGTPQNVTDIASGGETSRLMLTIKSLMANRMKLPTIIFDEVDTGVSGEIADKMGDMMREMGLRMQVVAITHLPQVAAKGEMHLKVYKTDGEERTVTHVNSLTMEERIREIAGMISGSEVKETALQAARDLLSQ